MNELTPQPNHCSNELSEEQITKLLASSTVPSNLSICLRGFESQEQANEVGRAVGSFLHLFGTVLNLERLDGVTVAYDYDAALATVETDTASSNQLAATNDSFARGVAMAIRVLREGQVKCHIVAAAGLMNSLRDPNDPAHSLAVGLLAHEAAHVHDLLIQDRAFPGVLLRRSTGYREGVLLQIAKASWDEYAACRLSAEFEHKDQLTWFEDTFCSFAEAARTRANEHIREYRRHGDLSRLVPQVVTEYGGLLKYGAYLLGHLDGLDLSVDKHATKAKELLNREKRIASAFEELAGCLRSMWATYEKWPGFQVFNPLCELADKILRDGGIEIEERSEGPYVVVPFTWETI